MTDSYEMITTLSRIERTADNGELTPTQRLHEIREACHEQLVAAGWRAPDSKPIKVA